MHYIQTQKVLYDFKIESDQFHAVFLKFDIRDRYLALASNKEIYFFSIYEENVIIDVKKHKISEIYEDILDIVIDSKDAPRGEPFKCMIACK